MARVRLAIGCTLLTASMAGAAEVVILKSADNPEWQETVDTLKRAGAAHSFSEHSFRGDRTEGARILGELKDKPVILVAFGALAAQLARELLPETPLVFCMVPEPEKLGLAPARGLSGVAFHIPVRNQLAVFRLVNPRGVRIGVVYGSASDRAVAEAKQAAPIVRLGVYARRVETADDVRPALRELLSGPEAVDALWLPADPLLLADESRRLLIKEASKAGRPVYTFSDDLVAEGALASISPDARSIGEIAAELVNRFASGDSEPGGLLVPRMELVINKKAASELKIQIPADALALARKEF